MTGVELALLLLGAAMLATSGWVWAKTHSSILVTCTVLVFIALAWWLGLIV